MRYALSTSPQRCTWAWLAEVWDIADEFEVFESGWTFDHFYPLFGDSSEACLEGWVTLTALLARTRRLRGGVLVSGMVYRHPGLLATMAATLDHTSGGRLELGVGAGWNEEECDAYGIELGSMTQRFDRFAEGLEVIESLLNSDTTTFDGQYYQLRDAMCWPKAVQDPLPVCIGGRGRRRTLPLAGRFAHHWNYSGGDLSEFAELRTVLGEHAAAHGRDVNTITCSVIARYTGDEEALRRDVASFQSVGADLVLVSLPKQAPPSVVAEIAAVLPDPG
jgi:F420-dependent oxidoreductase-like protein